MEMINKKDLKMRRCLLAVAIFFGMSATAVDASQTEDISSSNSNAIVDTSDTETDNPDTATDNPDTATDNPDTATDNPDVATDDPNTATDNPDTATDNPDTATDNPDVATDDPDTATDNSDTATDNPDVATDNPDTATDNSDTTTDNSDTETDNPDTATDNPDVATDNPDTATDNPDTTTDNLDTATGNSDTATDNPDTTTDNPDTTVVTSDARLLHFIDENGNVAADKIIVTNAEFAALLENNPDLDVTDFFFVDNKIYFVGDNVSEVLDGLTFDGVVGIPIKAWDGKTFDNIQTLISGYMSGLPYKNYETYTELELALMQDLGDDVDREKLFGKSIYANKITFTNTKAFTSTDKLAIGLHIWGARNNITQSGDISLRGKGAVGIRVDGYENQLKISSGANIQSTGSKGTGLLISYGRDHDINVIGDISAAGNAVEFDFGENALGISGEYRGSYLRYLRGVNEKENVISAENLPLIMSKGEFNYTANELDGALVNDFNLIGTIQGDKNAIYIGKGSFVKNINVDSGGKIDGDIVSDWKHFKTSDGFLSSPSKGINPIKIQYDGELFDVTDYIPDLVTKLNFNRSLRYSGNISGADNIKVYVNKGTLRFSGTADVVSVEVMEGAKVFGGNFKLNNMDLDMAYGFSDETTGKFINHGTLAASSANTNLVIDGDLISDGILQKKSGGTAGSIIVNGNANVEGSTVTTDNLLPNVTETVLVANSISGEIKNSVGKPVAVSGMLNATGEIVDNTLVVTTSEANNTPELNSQETATYEAMNTMLETLEQEDNSLQDEMTGLYNLEPKETKTTLKQIGSNDSAQVMSIVQQNTIVDKMISRRIAGVFAPDYIDVNISPMSFADGETDSPEMTIKVKVPSRQENNFWLNYMKNWGSLRGGTDYHGSAIIGGYDRSLGDNWRAGIFATYGTIGYGVDSSRATVYDTRFGLYAGYHNKASNVYLYVNGGQLRNSLHRGISSLGLATNANYKSHIVEVGGEYKYDLSPKKTWHISPFVGFQTSHLKQKSYNERGAGIYNQHVEAGSNTYFAAQTGFDFKRYYRTGMFGMRFGVKHGFAGADPDLKISYEGDLANSYRLRQKRDKTHFICSLRGENEFMRGWFMSGEAELQLGENDKDVTASVMLRRTW